MTDLLVVKKSSSDLPDELVVEVMSNLPVKSLVRFKSVCRSWKHLIESPGFIDMHLRMTNREHRVVYSFRHHKPVDDLSQEQSQSLNPLPVRKGTVVVGACNGIVCMEPYCLEEKKRLFMFNPSTRECSYVPDELDGKYYGFCYLPKTQEYQIISFTNQLDNKKVDMMILTLGNTKYLRSVKDVTVPGWITGTEKATCGTTFSWLGTDNDVEILICYDAIEERFSRMNIPPSPYPSTRSLSVLNDSVVMFAYPKTKTDATFFDMWILVDDISKGKSWRKYRKIGPLNSNAIMQPISIGSYGTSIVFLKNTISNENHLFYYDLETDEVIDLKLDGLLTMKVTNYVVSLVSMKSLGLDTTYY